MTDSAHSLLPPLITNSDQVYEGTILQNNSSEEFFCTYMLILMLQGDLVNARHLWRRPVLPEKLKTENGELSAVWAVGKCLWNDDVVGAYKAMKFTSRHHYVTQLLGKLKARTVNQQLKLVSKAYTSIHASELMARLDQSEDEVRRQCSDLAWEISSNGFVAPKPLQENALMADGQVQDSILLLSKLASFVTYLEQKTLVVDTKINAKVEGGNLTAAAVGLANEQL
jgi:CSN8/PSMD8/EIF3K family